MTLLRTRTLPLSLAMVEVLQLVVIMLCRTLSLQAKHAKVGLTRQCRDVHSSTFAGLEP